MGPPPRSLTAEANSCFMVRVLHGPNRIQGCGASIAPERGLPSDQLYRTSNNEGHRVAVTLDTKVLIQGCGASIAPERGLPSDQLYRTSNNEGHRVAVTLDTKVLIQGCVKTPMSNFSVEGLSRLR